MHVTMLHFLRASVRFWRRIAPNAPHFASFTTQNVEIVRRTKVGNLNQNNERYDHCASIVRH
jgi:hypothetical protein